MEAELYNPNGKCVASLGSAQEDTNDVIKLSASTAKEMATYFKSIWKKYKLTNPSLN
jgi:hypothetical protein